MSYRKSHYTSPADLPLVKELPDPFAFQDGRRVQTLADWEERSRELQDLFHYYMYGYMPDTSGEQVTYEKTEQGLRVQVTRGDAQGSFTARISLPSEDGATAGPYPVIFTIGSLEGWQPDGQAATNHVEQANKRGYAVVMLLPQEIAARAPFSRYILIHRHRIRMTRVYLLRSAGLRAKCWMPLNSSSIPRLTLPVPL